MAMLKPDRMLGATGIKVPLIGYGTAALGEKKTTEAEAVRCLNYAIDSGITYLDTSPGYGSEGFIGQVMKRCREEEILIDEVRPIVEADAKESKAGKSSLFWLHDTSVMGWAQHDEPVMVDY